MKLLSYSRLSTYDRCGKSFDYKYNQKLYPVPRFLTVDNWLPRVRGTLVHSGLEYGMHGKSVAAGVGDKVAEILGKEDLGPEHIEALKEYQQHAIEVASESMRAFGADEWETVCDSRGNPMLEYSLVTPLPAATGWDGFLGIFDRVARHIPTNQIYVVDYKTRERFEEEGKQLYSLQFAAYQWQLLQVGIRTVGSLQFQVKPERPKRATTELYRIDKMHRSERFLANVWQEQIIKKAAKISSDTQLQHVMNTWNCQRCDYAALCLGELQENDVDIIRSVQYSVRNTQQ